MAKELNQLNLTVVALVALVAIVGLVALVMNAAPKLATGSQFASAQDQNTAGQATGWKPGAVARSLGDYRNDILNGGGGSAAGSCVIEGGKCDRNNKCCSGLSCVPDQVGRPAGTCTSTS